MVVSRKVETRGTLLAACRQTLLPSVRVSDGTSRTADTENRQTLRCEPARLLVQACVPVLHRARPGLLPLRTGVACELADRALWLIDSTGSSESPGVGRVKIPDAAHCNPENSKNDEERSNRFISSERSSNCGCQSGRERAENIAAVTRSEQVFARTFRMRHQTEYVTFTIANSGDVITRTVWVSGVSDSAVWFAIAKHDAVFPL